MFRIISKKRLNQFNMDITTLESLLDSRRKLSDRYENQYNEAIKLTNKKQFENMELQKQLDEKNAIIHSLHERINALNISNADMIELNEILHGKLKDERQGELTLEEINERIAKENI